MVVAEWHHFSRSTLALIHDGWQKQRGNSWAMNVCCKEKRAVLMCYDCKTHTASCHLIPPRPVLSLFLEPHPPPNRNRQLAPSIHHSFTTLTNGYWPVRLCFLSNQCLGWDVLAGCVTNPLPGNHGVRSLSTQTLTAKYSDAVTWFFKISLTWEASFMCFCPVSHVSC